MKRDRQRAFEQCFNLQTIDSRTFRAPPRHIGGIFKATRLFGGQIIAQTLQAATRTAPLLTPLHVHVRFILPGDLDTPIRYEVDSEQLSQNLRCVVVKQDNRTLATCRVVFSAGSGHSVSDLGLRWDRVLNEVPPHVLLNTEQLAQRYSVDDSLDDLVKKAVLKRLTVDFGPLTPFEFRPTDPEQFALLRPTQPTLTVWAKLRPELIDSHISPLQIVLILSDFVMITAALIQLRAGGRKFHSTATLAHSVWLHCDKLDAHDWLLFRVECTALADDRGLVRGWMFTQAGQLVVSLVQECLMRAKI